MDVELKARSLGDFWVFVTEVLGHCECADLGWSELVEDHKDLCRFLQFDEHLFKLIMMPRYSLKSCICTVGRSLWILAHEPNARILIYSDAATKAEGFLTDIKNHITGKAGNSRFRELFPGWETDAHKGKWNESQIVVRVRESSSKEPSVDTGGIETSKIGMHYDYIIFDDMVSDVNVTTKSLMDKVWDCYKKSLSLLKPGGAVTVVGTRWNFGDSYGRILEDEGDDWGTFIKRAEVDGKYPFASIGLTKEFLQKQKERQGSYFYSCLYLNSPVDDSTALFKHDDFKFYGDRVDTEGLYVTCTVDPAGEGEDFTGITVVGTDKDMRIFLLYANHAQLKPFRIVKEIIRLSYAFKFIKVGIETNTYNGMLKKDLDLSLAEERKNKKFNSFGVEEFRSTCRKGEGKRARILSLQPFHERGDLIFPGKSVESLKGSYSELADQMMSYTHHHKPIHDDILDSLSFHVQMSRRGYVSVDSELPEGSIAAIMEEERNRMNKAQRLIPRRYRKNYEPVF